MLSRKRYILMMVLVLFSALKVVGQDWTHNVCVGETKKYWVPDSIVDYTYKWIIKDLGTGIPTEVQNDTRCLLFTPI